MAKKKPVPPTEAATIERLVNLYVKIAEHEMTFSRDDDTPWQWVDAAAGAVSDLLGLDDNSNPTNTALTKEQVLVWVAYFNHLQDAVDSTSSMPGPVLPAIPEPS